MRTLVVTLERATDRQQNIAAQFKAIGHRFEYFHGVDGREGHHPLFAHYNEPKRLKARGEPLSSGQLGCFASHYRVWQECVDSQEAVLVIEDDALIDPERFRTFVNAIPELPEDVECLRLFENKSKVRKGIHPRHLAGELYVKKFLKGHMSTTGYYLTPSGARKFLRGASEWILPVDLYMDQFWQNGVECFGVTPPCLTNDEQFQSMIDDGKGRPGKPIGTKIRRERYALAQNILRVLANLRYRIGHHTTRTKIAPTQT